MKPTKTRKTLGRAGRRAVSLVLALLLCLPAYAFAATGAEDQRPAAASSGASESDPAKDDGANADDREKPDVSEAMDLFDAIDAFLATSAFEALAVDVRSGFRDLAAASRAAAESGTGPCCSPICGLAPAPFRAGGGRSPGSSAPPCCTGAPPSSRRSRPR